MKVIVLCLTTLGSFATLFIAAKLIGHKQISQLDFFLLYYGDYHRLYRR